jgi:shikimate kinase
VKRRLLFLIGYRGAGKTEVARLLAPMLAWSWLDADAVLEERHAQSIRQIFAAEGEGGFRAKESALLQELSGLNDHVIATGGGVILREENRAVLKRGAVVWLRAPADVLWQRIQADANTAQRRPDLAQGGLAEIEEMLRVREPLYQGCQDFTVGASESTPLQIAEMIAVWFRQTA